MSSKFLSQSQKEVVVQVAQDATQAGVPAVREWLTDHRADLVPHPEWRAVISSFLEERRLSPAEMDIFIGIAKWAYVKGLPGPLDWVEWVERCNMQKGSFNPMVDAAFANLFRECEAPPEDDWWYIHKLLKIHKLRRDVERLNAQIQVLAKG